MALAGWSMIHYGGDVQPLGYSVFDPSTNAYVERVPVSTADPGPDVDPMDDDTNSETHAIRLIVSGTSVAGGEVIAPDGSRQTVVADRYVLAATAIEDARLLFLSDPAGVGNSSGLVGRNLMFDYGTTAIGIFDERLHGDRGRSVTHAITDFRGVPNDPNHPLAHHLQEPPTTCPARRT